jgi:hypothetical protein
MWMGGVEPLGYDRPTDPATRALVVNEAEAETVRLIFRKYLELGAVSRLEAWLIEAGIRSKTTTSRRGRVFGGAALSRGALFHILKRRVYLGEITHKDASYPGAHPAIVDRALFDAVQARLSPSLDLRLRRSTNFRDCRLPGRSFVVPVNRTRSREERKRYEPERSARRGEEPHHRRAEIRPRAHCYANLR